MVIVKRCPKLLFKSWSSDVIKNYLEIKQKKYENGVLLYMDWMYIVCHCFAD